MEIFGRQVIGLLDHLDIPEAVLGGTSLGANVTLEATNHAPNRVRGMVLEMPVLERAAPAAALMFLPLTILYAEGASTVRAFAKVMKHMPRGFHLYWDVLLDLLSRDPEPSAAVLHGLLTGRLAPHHDDREKLDHPSLIIAHRALLRGAPDMLHPFSDAEALHRELPNSDLITSKSFFELRFAPNRLSDAIADFLDEVWSV
jgi:pimeloyl-ACP methyl ester carboxylesterase